MTSINFDYSNFDPNAGATPNFPENGNYNFKLLTSKEGATQSGDRKIIIDFIAQGTSVAFPINYNIGHHNQQTRQIAFESLGKLYFGITGNKPPATGFDLQQLNGGTFNADFVVTKGEKYTNADFRNIRPIEGSTAPAEQVQQAVVNKPSW